MGNSVKPRILLILVLYNQNYKTSLTYRSILKCLDEYPDENIGLLIYDNSASANLLHEEKSINYVKYYHNPSNPGVSSAYNYGYRLAKKEKIDWVILLDQDTNLPANSLLEYKNQINAFPEISIFAPVLKTKAYIVSPSKYKYRRGFALKEISFGKTSLKNIRPLNSGLCLNLDVFEKVSGYNENIKLDFSDFDFMRRVAKYYKSFVVIPIEALHFLSSEDESILSARMRYKFYCNGALNSIINLLDFFPFSLVCLFRGLKLTSKYKVGSFLKIYWEYFICRRSL